ncbi:MAG TPA: hypothetical protein VGL05_22450 [Kribbella sp.]
MVPPSWPSTPRRNWIPPKTWRPDPSWPPAPARWRFWVDGRGKPVNGPIGRYGAPSRRAVYAGAAALLVFAGVNVWAVLAIGLFDAKPDDAAAVKFVEDTPSPSATISTTPPVVRRTTATPPPAPHTTAPTKTRTTQRPKQAPTSHRTTERTTATPTPTRTTTKPRPRPTVTPSTRDELLRQYCIQQGIDPAWCDPSNWQHHP